MNDDFQEFLELCNDEEILPLEILSTPVDPKKKRKLFITHKETGTPWKPLPKNWFDGALFAPYIL